MKEGPVYGVYKQIVRLDRNNLTIALGSLATLAGSTLDCVASNGGILNCTRECKLLTSLVKLH
jgi:hypothetical protein